MLTCLIAFISWAQNKDFCSSVEQSFLNDEKTIAVCDFTTGLIYFINARSWEKTTELKGFNHPFGLVWSDSNTLSESEYGTHVFAKVYAVKYKIEKRISCVKYPIGITTAGNGKLLVPGFGKSDSKNDVDNPTLIEVERTTPYTHGGSAETINEIYLNNTSNKHGRSSHQNQEELEALEEYVLSL